MLQDSQLNLRFFMARAEPPTPLAGASPGLLAEGEDKHPAAHQRHTRDRPRQELNTGPCGSVTRDTQSHRRGHTNPQLHSPKAKM